MSFSRPFSEARSIIGAIQREKTDGADGEGSSPILHGSATSGVTATVSTANEDAQTSHSGSEMSQLRTKLKVRTGSLTRKYASTGS